jgi:O-antigen ligase
MINSRILPAIGPALFAIMSLAQPFSRGLVNVSYGLLFLWSLAWLFHGRRRWPVKVLPIPDVWLKGFALFILAYILTSLAGSNVPRSLKFLFVNSYVILALPVTWLALSHRPGLIRLLPYLYGLGLIITGVITFQDAGLCVKCVRSKSALGVIELSGVLAQLGPVMVGALAMSLAAPGELRRPAAAFFLLTLLAAYVAMRINCGRITMICLPVLAMVTFIANRRDFINLIGAAVVLAALAGALFLARDDDVAGRFKDILAPASASANNTERYNYWEQGFEVFKERPVFGVGPATTPNLSPEKNINNRRGVYAHAHNIYLTFMAETGLVGLIAFLFFITRPIKLLWPFRRSQDRLTFFWTWSAFTVMLHLFMNGVTDYVFNNKMIMLLHFSVMGAAMWVALGRGPETRQKPTQTSLEDMTG